MAPERAWMIVPASAEAFDGIRDFAARLAAALSMPPVSLSVDVLTTREDRAAAAGPRPALGDWTRLPVAEAPRAVFLNYAPQAWLRRDTRALLAQLRTLRAAGARVILIVHEYQLDPSRSVARAAARVVFRRMARAFAAPADAIVATHEFVADCLRADGIAGAAALAIIPAGSNIPDPERDRPQAQPNRVVMFGQAAGMDARMTAAAARTIAARRAELVWICRRADEALEWLERHGVPRGAIRIAAGLDARGVSRELSAAAVALAPIIDGVSTRRTTVAAMLQHALPVAGSDGRATSPLLRDSRAFALTGLAAPDDIAHALNRLLDDPAARLEMGTAARALFESALSWPRIAGQYRQLVS